MPTPGSDHATTGNARRRRIALPVLIALVTIVLTAAPSFLGNYWLRVLCNIYMYVVLAQGINIMAGYTGYPAFGNVAFFGIGGYCTGVLMVKLQAPFAVGLVAGMLACPLLVLLLGPALLRLKGHYFAIATLGLNEAIREFVSNASDLTGGGMGLSLPLPPGGAAANAVKFYYLFFVAMAASVWLTWEFSRRNLGLACRAIRDNETKAEATGIHTTRSKTVAWMLSAMLTGMVGSINAYWLAYIDPPSMFNMTIAVKSFVIFLLGGAGTVLGPVAGAVFVELLATLTWSNLLNWHLGAMGLLIVVAVMVFPGGFRTVVRDMPSLATLLTGGRARPKDRPRVRSDERAPRS